MTTVWVVIGGFQYEGSDLLTICESEAIAEIFQQERENKKSYDYVKVEQRPLITGVDLILGLQEIRV